MSRLYRILAQKATTGLIVLMFFVFPLTAYAKVPNDPNYTDQKRMWQQINAPQAWDITTGSAKVVVATIDTGVDIWHEDLKQQIWTNTKEIPDNGIDDDRNGYVDDVNGWNFVEDTSNVRTSVFNSQDDPEVVRHGTIIAGLLGAQGDNGIDGVGINWKVTIMPLRALENSGTGSYTTIARAVDYAVDNGASVISLSFEGDADNRMLKQSLYRAYQKGVVVVTAAGNHDPQVGGDLNVVPHYPACYDNGDTHNWMITVASVDTNDFLSDFSNYGSCVDIAAPGENIFSTERYAPQFGYNEEFGGGWNGTSFSTPLVAGTAALIRGLHPEWTPDQVIKTILDNATPVRIVTSGTEQAIGHGVLDVGRAVEAAAKSKAPALRGDLFYVIQNSIKHYSVLDQADSTFAVVHDADVKAVASESVSDSRYVAALIKRGSYYYVQLYNGGGVFLSEVPLHTSRKIVDSRFEMVLTNEQVPHFIVSSYDAKKKITTFSEFDENGMVAKEHALAGSVQRFALNESKTALTTAQLSGTKLLVTQIALDGSSRYRWQTTGITGVDDIRMAALDATPTESVVLIVRAGKVVKQITLEGKFLGVRQEVVEAKAATPATPWKLLIIHMDGAIGAYITHLKSGAGSYPYTNGAGAEVGTLNVPSLPAQAFK